MVPDGAARPEQSAVHQRENELVEKAFRILSFVVLALMVTAVLYAGGIGIYHWTGIGV